MFKKIGQWFRRVVDSVEEEFDGGLPVATPPPGAGWSDRERETSSNAQMEGAVGEPWPGNR